MIGMTCMSKDKKKRQITLRLSSCLYRLKVVLCGTWKEAKKRKLHLITENFVDCLKF